MILTLTEKLTKLLSFNSKKKKLFCSNKFCNCNIAKALINNIYEKKIIENRNR